MLFETNEVTPGRVHIVPHAASRCGRCRSRAMDCAYHKVGCNPRFIPGGGTQVRSLMIIAGGLILLGILTFAASRMGAGNAGVVTAAKAFIPIWLVAALINMWMGVSKAGYSVSEEFPIFLAIFAAPAAVAALVWWKLV
jgi:hypothetical protein